MDPESAQGHPWGAQMDPGGARVDPGGAQVDPGGAQGDPWDAQVDFVRIGLIIGGHFASKWPQVRSLSTTYGLPELIRGDPRGSPGIRGCAQSDIWQPPFTRAGGQDDVSS